MDTPSRMAGTGLTEGLEGLASANLRALEGGKRPLRPVPCAGDVSGPVRSRLPGPLTGAGDRVGRALRDAGQWACRRSLRSALRRWDSWSLNVLHLTVRLPLVPGGQWSRLARLQHPADQEGDLHALG